MTKSSQTEMKLCFSIVALVLVYSGVECLNNSESSDPGHDICPPWFIYNETTSKCQCGNDLGGIVKCNDKEGAQANAILECYCMTHDEKLGTVVGNCLLNCVNHYSNDSIVDLYQEDSVENVRKDFKYPFILIK